MSNTLKCPNPSCPYLFDPTRVPPGVVLTCPRCAMQFTLGPPPPQQAAPPQYQPLGAPPGYPPTGYGNPAPPGYPPAGYGNAAPPIPLSPADAELASFSATAPAGEGEPGQPRFSSSGAGSGRRQTLVLMLMSLAMLGGVGAMVYFSLKQKPASRSDSGTDLRDLNISFERPEGPWTQDGDMRVKLGSPIAIVYKRAEPDAFFAFGAKDYQTREPRPSDLMNGLRKPLANVFEDIREEPTSETTWLGQPVMGFDFRARWKDGGTAIGQAIAVGYKGIGYWSICWTDENQAQEMAPAFVAARKNFHLLKQRDKWTAKQGAARPFGGHKLRYEVLDSEDLWKEPDAEMRPAANEDPNADLLLTAKIKQSGRDFNEEATLLALVLNSGGGDPLAEAKKYVEDQRTADVKAAGGTLAVKFTDASGPVEGDTNPEATPAEGAAPVARFVAAVTGARGQSRLIVVSAIKMEDKVVAVYAWCSLADRAAFEASLVRIAASLREAK